MESKTIKQVSILGLVLVAASAVTAAMIPNKTNTNNLQAANGTLTASSAGGGILTCRVSASPDVDLCFATTAAGTNVAATDDGTNITTDLVNLTFTRETTDGVASSSALTSVTANNTTLNDQQ